MAKLGGSNGPEGIERILASLCTGQPADKPIEALVLAAGRTFVHFGGCFSGEEGIVPVQTRAVRMPSMPAARS
jgi:hypothetical protein